MARGWESKSVEAQQEAARTGESPGVSISSDERDRRVQRRTLELASARLRADLERATAPAHRSMLEVALKSIEERIAGS